MASRRRSVAEDAPLISEHLEQTVLRVLAKDPDVRQQTAQEFQTELGLETSHLSSSTVDGAAFRPTEPAGLQ